MASTIRVREVRPHLFSAVSVIQQAAVPARLQHDLPARPGTVLVVAVSPGEGEELLGAASAFGAASGLALLAGAA
jgi:hypothetical protein